MKSVFKFCAPFLAVAALSAACRGDDNGGKSTAAPKDTAAASTSAPGAASPASTAKPATGAKVPADACALLTIDEVRKVSATAGEGKKMTPPAGPGQSLVSCRWEWPEGISTLDVTVMTLPAGVTADFVKISFQAEVKSGGREVSGIGDYAISTSVIAADTEVKALVKGLLLIVDLNGLGAREKQELVIAVARAAAGRI